ncbi:hypothetical protein [Methylobacter sp.]|uniref:hypothetical protein n=1 Tax=Methylobacter sp. TaxID=2051955 RepID=UPI003DA4D627
MHIININEWLACKPEDRKALLQRTKVDNNDMREFVESWNKQEVLKESSQDMPADKYLEIWNYYENKMRVKANSIKKNNKIDMACKAYPEYKDALQTYIALL